MANSTINGLSAATALATNDQFVLWSASANGTRKLQADKLDVFIFRSRSQTTTPIGKTFQARTFSSTGAATTEDITFANLVNSIEIGADNLTTGAVTADKLHASIKQNSWVEKTTAYTALASDRIFADTTNASFTITLPSAPSVFDWVIITDIANNWSTKPLTIKRGSTSHKINGLSEDLICQLSAEVILRYEGTTKGWRVFAYGY